MRPRGTGLGKAAERHEHPKEHGNEHQRSLPVLYPRARTRHEHRTMTRAHGPDEHPGARARTSTSTAP